MFVISLGKGEHCQLAGFYFQPLCFVIVNAGGPQSAFPLISRTTLTRWVAPEHEEPLPLV